MEKNEFYYGFRGVWFPKGVWENKDLSAIEKVFFMEIDIWDGEEAPCYQSNDYFSELFEISKLQCTKIVKKLEEMGLIEIEYDQEGKKIKNRIIRKTEKGYYFSKGGLDKI